MGTQPMPETQVTADGNGAVCCTIFVSYSHRDKEWKDRLVTQLAALGTGDKIGCWHDEEIEVGSDWELKIFEAMRSAKIAVLIVTANFLTSDYIMRKEVPFLLARDGLIIMPVIAEPCPWQTHQWLSKMQAHRAGTPLSAGDEHKINADLEALAMEIFNKLYPPTALVKKEGNKHVLPVLPPPLPVRSPPPPGRWLAATKGRFDYWRARATRQKLLVSHRDNLEQKPLERLTTDDGPFKVPYENWDSRAPTRETQRIVTLITGPVGTGKTRLRDEMLKPYLPAQQAVTAAPQTEPLFALLTTDDVEAAFAEAMAHGWRPDSQEKMPPVLWPRLLANVKDNLSPVAFAHALNSRPLLLYIEDLHTARSAGEVLPLLRQYFRTYHHWGAHLTLLITTRELYQPGPTELDVAVIQLKPLEQYEPQNFFLRLCEKNKVELQVSAIGESLGQAFATPTTRTPLFVVICAWLVKTSMVHRRDISRLLQMEASKVFDHFIEELYHRAHKAHAPGRFAFRRLYAQLALALWPQWQHLDEDSIVQHLSRFAAPAGQALTPHFLLANGFLYREPQAIGAPTLSFPHQSMSDYLAAKWMVDAADFTPLQGRTNATRLEGLVDFLAELITTEQQLIALARDELTAFVKLMLADPGLLRRGGSDQWKPLLEQLVAAAASWATPQAKRRPPPETWQGLRVMLATAAWARAHFCAQLTQVRPTAQGVEALAALGSEESTQLLKRWLRRDHEPFGVTVEAEPVRAFLLQLLTGDDAIKPEGWLAFRLAWVAADGTLRAAAEKFVRENVSYFGDEKLNELLDLGSPALKLLAHGSGNTLLHVKQRISSQVARRLDKVLIPPGNYEVLGEGDKPVKVRITSPLLVPRQSQMLRNLQNREEAIRMIMRALGGKRLMSFKEAQVVARYFADRTTDDPAGQCGVTFPQQSDPYPEAYMEKRQLNFFVFTDPTKQALTVTAKAAKGEVPLLGRGIARIAYRIVEHL